MTHGKLLYGAAQIADYIGVRRRIVYHLIEKGALPHKKSGRMIIASRSALDDALDSMGKDATSSRPDPPRRLSDFEEGDE
jgi:excisionase family DNA binding protein